jgi:hypothetical protein
MLLETSEPLPSTSSGLVRAAESMGDELGTLLLAVVLGAVFLHVFFRAVQLSWPESYFGVGELAAYSISASPWKYLLFRFGPVFATALFAGVAADRAGSHGFPASLGVAAMHATLTSGYGLLQATRWPSALRRRRRPILLIRLAVLVGVIGVGVLAGSLLDLLGPLVPPLGELSATLWTGVIAGVIGAFIVRVSRGHPIHEHEMVDRARKEIPAELWDLAARAAIQHDADVDLVRAIMVVEHLQRPAWVRRAERLRGKVDKRGTYGIMQVSAERPISDAESIERAAAERLSGTRVKSHDGYLDLELLKEFARTYNGSPDYVPLLEVAYGAVRTHGRSYSSIGRSSDHRPLIEIDVIERLSGLTRIEGTAVVPEGRVQVTALQPGANEVIARTVVVASQSAPKRGIWSIGIDVPADATQLLATPTFEQSADREEIAKFAVIVELHQTQTSPDVE